MQDRQEAILKPLQQSPFLVFAGIALSPLVPILYLAFRGAGGFWMFVLALALLALSTVLGIIISAEVGAMADD